MTRGTRRGKALRSSTVERLRDEILRKGRVSGTVSIKDFMVFNELCQSGRVPSDYLGNDLAKSQDPKPDQPQEKSE